MGIMENGAENWKRAQNPYSSFIPIQWNSIGMYERTLKEFPMCATCRAHIILRSTFTYWSL